ncbi:MAG: serine/threonine-protein kinase [Nannocystaceae bacterium]|nr:serine/threonine-protein kinase [Nannocystaceae bacterium]
MAALDAAAPRCQAALVEAAHDDARLRAWFGAAAQTDAGDRRLLAQICAAVRGEPTRIGRHRVLRRLGRGGFGEVFEAHDPVLQRGVAIKLLHARGREGRARSLQQEAQALARIAHPNVVEVFEVGEHDGEVFIVMELVEGTDLGSWAAARPRSLDEQLAVLRAAGEGLAAAHAVGIVHGDFKPANVLVAADGRVKVADFGLARWLEQPHDDGIGLAGTLPYLAPELQRGAGPSPSADVFAWGATACEIVCGRRVFTGASAAALLQAKLQGTSTAVTAAASDVPGWLRRRLDAALAPDPARRPASMRALLDGLQPPRRGATTLALAAVVVTVGALGATTAAPPCAPGAAPQWATRAQAVLADDDVDARTLLEQLRARERDDEAQRQAVCAAGRREARACIDAAAVRTGALVDALVASEQPSEHVRPTLRALQEIRGPEGCVDDPARARLDPDFVAAQAASRAAFAAGDPARARTLLGDALARADATADPRARAEASRLQGMLALDRFDADAAFDAFNTAYWLATSAGDDATAAMAAAEQVLTVGNFQGRPLEAEAWRRHAEAALARVPDHAWLELALVTDAFKVDHEHGRVQDAVAMAERAVELAAALDGGDGPQSLRAQRMRVEAAVLAGDVTGATAAVATLRDRTAAVFGEDDVEVVLADLTQANVALAAGAPERAEVSLRRALDGGARVHGRAHAFNLTALQNLAAVELERGDAAAAVAHLDEALAIAQASLDRGHPRVTWIVGARGVALTQAGRLDEADAALQAALVGWTASHGSHSVKVGVTLSNLADLATARGQHEQAIDHARRAADILETALGEAHPHAAAFRANLGRALMAADRCDEAVPQFRVALARLQAAQVERDAATARQWLAQCGAAP